MNRRMNQLIVVFYVVSSMMIVNYANAQTAQHIGPEAIWTPATDAFETIHKQCDSSSDFSACFFSYLQKSGASPQAIQFVKMTDQMGYLSNFRKVGPVDVAYVTFPFRANENQGCYLVNGNPSMIDVDNLQALPQSELDNNPAYQQLAKQYPNISLWLGDRYTANNPLMESLPGGGKRFIVNYVLRDQCHACATVGYTSFGFEFDLNGKLQGIHLSSIQAAGDTGAKFTDPTQPIQINSGQLFTIVLDSNRTTGYQWQLANPVDPSILQKVNNIYKAPETNQAGAAGKEVWTFKAVGKGKTTVEFHYVRPWEKTTPRATSTSFEVVVE
jgi:predicted secreted protein